MEQNLNKKVSWIDEEAELRYECLQMAIQVTDNADAAVNAAKIFVAFVEGNLTNSN